MTKSEVDYGNPLGVEVRVVRDDEKEGAPVRVVSGSRFYSTSPGDLWQAITQAERLERWFAPITGDLELGGRYAIEGNAVGTITRCERPEAIDLTWEFAGNVSWVSLRLAPENDGVRLTLEHTMPMDPASEAHWKTYGPGATGVGWDLAFFGLGLYLDAGDMVDRDAGLEWMGTDAGKDFMSACATAWGDAHVAAGEDEAVATPMAERTAKFYRGE